MKGITVALLVFSMAGEGRAQSPPPLAELLRRAGKAVELFWGQFSSMNCTELVSQAKLGKEGKPVYRQESAFDYLVLTHASSDDLSVEESRVKVRSAGSSKNRPPLLVTNGFSTLALIFHPYFQGSFEYSEPKEESFEGRPALRVGFRHLRGARSPSCLRLRGRDYPLEWAGAAWVEPRSGSLLRIQASLESNLEDLGLQALSADVRYAPVRFSDSPEVYWLPAEATIEAQTVEQRWRNVHRFSNYRHFTVETKTQ